MKNKFVIISIAVLLFLAPALASAQEGGGRPAYEAGDLQINVGASFGILGYESFGGGSFGLPFVISGEYGKIADGAVSTGVYVGYLNKNYDYIDGDLRLSVFSIGNRTSFHAAPLLKAKVFPNLNEEKWDIYGSLLLGYKFYAYHYADSQYTFPGGASFTAGVVVGGRYMFLPNLGAYLELGREVHGFGAMGLTLRL